MSSTTRKPTWNTRCQLGSPSRLKSDARRHFEVYLAPFDRRSSLRLLGGQRPACQLNWDGRRQGTRRFLVPLRRRQRRHKSGLVRFSVNEQPRQGTETRFIHAVGTRAWPAAPLAEHALAQPCAPGISPVIRPCRFGVKTDAGAKTGRRTLASGAAGDQNSYRSFQTPIRRRFFVIQPRVRG